MLFNVNTGNPGNPGESFLVSGSSWSACVAYFEGLGKNLVSITTQIESLILNQTGTTIYYAVVLKDNDTNSSQTFIIYDTFDNVILWINSQTDKTLTSIQKTNKQFVSI